MLADRMVGYTAAISFLVALTIPASEEKVIVVRTYHKPLMQLLCKQGKAGKEEYERTCRARLKSI